MSQPLLSVNGLMMRFGCVAVNNVNLELYPQEIVSLIGLTVPEKRRSSTA